MTLWSQTSQNKSLIKLKLELSQKTAAKDPEATSDLEATDSPPLKMIFYVLSSSRLMLMGRGHGTGVPGRTDCTWYQKLAAGEDSLGYDLSIVSVLLLILWWPCDHYKFWCSVALGGGSIRLNSNLQKCRFLSQWLNCRACARQLISKKAILWVVYCHSFSITLASLSQRFSTCQQKNESHPLPVGRWVGNVSLSLTHSILYPHLWRYKVSFYFKIAFVFHWQIVLNDTQWF